jgi:hypothetical protein
MWGEDILFVSLCKEGGQLGRLIGLKHYFRDSHIAEFPMLWISHRPYRCVKNPADAKCEHFVAPNAVFGSPFEFINVGA